MASVRTRADLDAAEAAFESAVSDVLASVTTLAAVRVPEMTFAGAVANADTLQTIDSTRTKLITVLNGFPARAAQASAQLRPLLPPS